jgi:hypothetical protein
VGGLLATNDVAAGDGERGLRLVIRTGPGAEPEEVERLTRQLRAELGELDVAATIPSSSEPIPEHAKAGGGVDLGTLLVTMSGAGGVFPMIIATIRDWLDRSRSAQGISMTIDGDTITLPRASQPEREELIRTWVARHGAAAEPEP